MALTNVMINNGATTPVAYTFVPQGVDNNDVTWLAQTVPTPTNNLSAVRIGLKLDRPLYNRGYARKGTTPDMKAIISIALPTMEVVGNAADGITPPPTVAFEEQVRVEFRMSERGLRTRRIDMRMFLRNLLNDPNIVSMIEDLVQPKI